MKRRRTPEQQKRDTEQRRLTRQINKHLYGVQEPGRAYVNGRDIPKAVVDPWDYSHPDSEVRQSA